MKVLVCVNHGIGNAIMALPLTRALKLLGHEVHVVVAELRGSDQVFKDNADIAEVHYQHECPGGFDVACCTQWCVPYIRGTCTRAKKFLMIEPGRDIPEDRIGKFDCRWLFDRYTKHEIEYNVDLARELGYEGPVPDAELPRSEPGLRVYEGKGVAIGIGYYKGDDHSYGKHWGHKNYVELCRRLARDGFIPILIGGDDDIANGIEIIRLARAQNDAIGNSIQNMTGRMALPGTFTLLSRYSAYIGNETFTVPATAALGVPCLSLVFDGMDFMSSPHKTYPYPEGMALYGKKVNMTVDLVYEMFTKFLEVGPWAKIERV